MHTRHIRSLSCSVSLCPTLCCSLPFRHTQTHKSQWLVTNQRVWVPAALNGGSSLSHSLRRYSCSCQIRCCGVGDFQPDRQLARLCPAFLSVFTTLYPFPPFFFSLCVTEITLDWPGMLGNLICLELTRITNPTVYRTDSTDTYCPSYMP